MDSPAIFPAFATAFLIILAYQVYARHVKYKDIPTIGLSGPLSSYLGVIKFIRDSPSMMNDGYKEYKNDSLAFKLPTIAGWAVVVTGKLTDELRRAPEDKLSSMAAISDILQFRYTIGSHLTENTYHLPILRNQLTRNLSALFPAIRDELLRAFSDELDVAADEWVSVPVHGFSMKVLSRANNRVFVGSPLCSNPEYRDFNIHFIVEVAIAAAIINLFPDFCKPIVAKVFARLEKSIQKAMSLIVPLIKEREPMDPTDRPDDFLTWLMNEAKGDERSYRNLTLRILLLNFAAVHTSSMTFTYMLLDLASRPEYLEPLREEIGSVVAEHGWTKESMGKMKKLDSFMKESQRVHLLGSGSLTRKAVQDYTFSNGTFISKGTTVTCPAISIHFDEALYKHAAEFDGFRFSKLGEAEMETAKYQMINTSLEFLAFGHGQHACPGRFLAVNELKCGLAHLVYTYDMKMKSCDKPRHTWFGFASIPDKKAEIIFRMRQT